MEKNHKHLLDGELVQYNDSVVPKIPVFTDGKDMTSEVYYFKPGQVLATHRHPQGEQIFVFIKGHGTMEIGDKKDHNVKQGDAVFIEAGQWHGITNSNDEEMIAIQITKVGAGAEYK